VNRLSRVRASAYPKLTLSLRVLGLRKDGYHEIEALTVSLGQPSDVVELTAVPHPGGVSFEVEGETEHVPGGMDNLAARAAEERPQAQPAPAWRVAVVGQALAARLQRPGLLQRLPRPVQWLGPFADLPQAAAGLQDAAVDLLVAHEPRLHDDWLARLQATAPALAARPKAVLYRYGAESTCAALAAAGAGLLREPQNDTVLGQWLQGVLQAPSTPSPTAVERVPPGAPPRRWDDAALADFAGLSSTIACECPRHVAELLMQLSHFEAYSAECRHRSPADAELHAYLQQVAATARARFEEALEHVALHEGLILPRTAPP